MAGDAPQDSDAQRRALLEEFASRSRTAARQAGLDDAAGEVLEALERAGVETLLLKGAALAQTLYRADEVRTYFDIDLLTAPSQIEAAQTVMRGLGYTSLNELQGVSDVGGSLHAETWSRSLPGFGNVTIDLHWRLRGCEIAPEAAWRALRSRRASVELAGRRVATLDPTGLALQLALHAAQHGPADVKAIGDLRRGLERWSRETWSAAGQLAAELGALEAFAAGLRLLPAGRHTADELALPAAESSLWTIVNRDARPRGTFHLSAFEDAEGVGDRLKLLRAALFPPRAWMLHEHRWAAGRRWRLVTAYGLHLLRCPVWAAQAWRYRRAERRSTRPA